MKNTMFVGLLCAAIGAPAIAGNDSYAIAAYNAGATETVYVYGPLPTNCDAAVLDVIRAAQEPKAPPSMAEIGYACATRDQIARLNLNPPICELVNSETYASGSGWAYICYRGIVDRFINPPPPPTAAELKQRRQAQEAAEAAQRQAAELAAKRDAKRDAERAAWQRYAVGWVYQRNKEICLQNLSARRLPGQDDPGLLCDRSARNSSANPTMDIVEYCKHLQSTNQSEITIHAACDTTR